MCKQAKERNAEHLQDMLNVQTLALSQKDHLLAQNQARIAQCDAEVSISIDN